MLKPQAFAGIFCVFCQEEAKPQPSYEKKSHAAELMLLVFARASLVSFPFSFNEVILFFTDCCIRLFSSWQLRVTRLRSAFCFLSQFFHKQIQNGGFGRMASGFEWSYAEIFERFIRALLDVCRLSVLIKIKSFLMEL